MRIPAILSCTILIEICHSFRFNCFEKVRFQISNFLLLDIPREPVTDSAIPVGFSEGRLLEVLDAVSKLQKINTLLQSISVENVTITDKNVALELNIELYEPNSLEIRSECSKGLKELQWVDTVQIILKQNMANSVGFPDVKAASDAGTGMTLVKNVVAVSSCKGGVGKSTVAVNLAYTLRKQGYAVGILDADIYGPSLPTMVSPANPAAAVSLRTPRLVPLEYEGVKLLSLGFMNQGAGTLATILKINGSGGAFFDSILF